MKKTTLLLAILIAATGSFAQYQLEKVPITDNKKLDHFMTGCATDGDKFIFSATDRKPGIRNQKLYYHNGYSDIEAVPESIMNGVTPGLVYAQGYKGSIFFGGYKGGTDGLYTWDGYTPVRKIADVGIHLMTYMNNCFVDDKMYFFGRGVGERVTYLYEIDLKTNKLNKLTDDKYNVDGVIAHEGNVYFFDVNKREYINCYNIANKTITQISTGIKEQLVKRGYGIHSAVSAGGYLYLVIYTEELGYELYECDGKSIQLVKNLSPYNNDGVSQGLINYNNKVYFAGNETGEEVYHLYNFDPISKEFTQVLKEGYYPMHFCVKNNKLYFTMSEEEKGTQVYEYDDITNKLTKLTNRDRQIEDGQFTPWKLTAIQNKLYVTSTRGITYPNKFLEIYTIDLQQASTGINQKKITTLKVTAHPNPTDNNTTVNVEIPTASKVKLILKDISGKQVYEHHTMATQQRHSIAVPMQELPAGVYVYQLLNESSQLLHSAQIVKR
ncbi:MAG: T9SS type A sorting domain-containing protein [Flavipsychrobacter sp.]